METLSRLSVFSVIVTVTVFGSAVFASDERPTPGTPDRSISSVLQAIDRMVANPIVDRVRPEYAQVVDFAEQSDRVLVTIDPQYFEFSGDKNLDSALLAYFVAGAVKFDLENPEAAREAVSDIPPAIRSALVYYKAHLNRHPERRHPFFERMNQLDRTGALDRYVAEAASHND